MLPPPTTEGTGAEAMDIEEQERETPGEEEEEEDVTIIGTRAAARVPTSRESLLRELQNYAASYPFQDVKTPPPTVVQSPADLDYAGNVFSPDGFAENYDYRLFHIHAGQASPGFAVDVLQARWLQDQCLKVPYTYANGNVDRDLYRKCEAGTWYHLMDTIRRAPSIQQFNTQVAQEATSENKNLALTAWALPDKIVWYNTTAADTHGANIFRLGRIKSIGPTSTPNIVDLAPHTLHGPASEQVRAWKSEQETSASGFASDFGGTHSLKAYNVLPVTDALRLAIFPRWVQVHDDAHDPRKRADEPAFCQLQWDTQSVVAENAFKEGRYYFWLSHYEPEMAGWVCRGLADIPNSVIASRALAHVPEDRFADIMRYFPATADEPAAGTTRVVWRDWLATYCFPNWTQELVVAGRANSIEYYMLDGANNTTPVQLVGVSRSRPVPFGTWNYSFRSFKVSKTQRTKFSDYDEAMAIVRNDPLPVSGEKKPQIGRRDSVKTRPARYWATHVRPPDVPLPPDPILTRHREGVRALFPLEALNYVSRILEGDPGAFVTTPDQAARGTRPPGSTPGRPGTSQRTAAAQATAAIHSMAQEEAARTPPPATPGPGGQQRRRGQRQSPHRHASNELDYSRSFARTNRPSGEVANDAAIDMLARLPDECPDPNWGSRRRLQNLLVSAADGEPTNRPVRVGNLAAIDHMGAFVAQVARLDSGLASRFCVILLNLIDGTGGGPGQPPPAPPGPGDNTGRGTGQGAALSPRSPRSPPNPDPAAGRNDAKRQRTEGGEQDTEHSHQRHRSSRDSHGERRRRERSPSPRRSRRASPPLLRERSPRPYRGRSPRSEPERRRRTPPPGRYRTAGEERRHQEGMNVLRAHAARQKDHYFGAPDPGPEPPVRHAEAGVVERAVRHHLGPAVRRGDYDPPTAPQQRDPERPPARSPSPPPSGRDRSPSQEPPPPPTYTDYFESVKERYPHGIGAVGGGTAGVPAQQDAPVKLAPLAAIRDCSYFLPKKAPVSGAQPKAEAPAPVAATPADTEAAPTAPAPAAPTPVRDMIPNDVQPAPLTELSPAESASPPHQMGSEPVDYDPEPPATEDAAPPEPAPAAPKTTGPFPGGTVPTVDAPRSKALSSEASNPPDAADPSPLATAESPERAARTPPAPETPVDPQPPDITHLLSPGAPVKIKIRVSGSQLSDKGPTSTIVNDPAAPAARDDADSCRVATLPTAPSELESPAHDPTPAAPAAPNAPKKPKKNKRARGDGDLPDKKKRSGRRDGSAPRWQLHVLKHVIIGLKQEFSVLELF